MNERLVTYFSLVNLLSFSNVQAGDGTDKKKKNLGSEHTAKVNI